MKMKEIPLRTYHQEIEKLIEVGNVNKAVEHCQYILKTYPMNLDTYRLLGKAYLEGKKYNDAADIFQRLLMSLPDDFVSHVGMSIIRDDENNINDSIWHMERAFEVQPSNPAIQEELKKLYGRRDGKEPSKIRLTRDALANMYTQGALYSQAIAEISAVLAEDPDRQDLKVMLARAYSKDGRKKQAVDICTELLKKNPYCFDALRILVSLLSSEENQQVISKYRSRLSAMDPYVEHSTVQDLDTQNVADNAIMIKYMGDDNDTSFSDSGILNSQPERRQAEENHYEKSRKLSSPDTMGNIPEESNELNLGHIKPNAENDIPDWIKELAPENIAAENGSEILEILPETPLISDDKVLESKQPVIESPANGVIEGSMDDIPGWLREMGTDELFNAEERDKTPIENPISESIDEAPMDQTSPVWMPNDKGITVSSEEQILEPDDYELPEWLKGIESEKNQEDLMALDGFDPAFQATLSDDIEDTPFEEAIVSESFSMEGGIEADLVQSPDDVIEMDDQKAAEDGKFITQPDAINESFADDSLAERSDAEEMVSVNLESGQDSQFGDLNDADAAFAWLESLAARQGANPDELITDPADRVIEPPDWIKNVINEEVSEESESFEKDDSMELLEKEDQFISESDLQESGQAEEGSHPQELPEMESPEEFIADLDEGMVRVEIQDNLEQIMDPQYSMIEKQDSVTEIGELVTSEDSKLDSIEFEESEELMRQNNTQIDEIKDEYFEFEAEEDTEIVNEVEPTQVRGDWKPLDGSGEVISSERVMISGNEFKTSEEEISQLDRVPMTGPLTRIPGKDVEKEAEILEKAQQLLGQRELKNALGEYQKLIKKGKLLEGVIHDLKEISYQYPIDVSVWQSLGDAYMRANQLQDALESYTKAEELLR